MPPLVYDDTLWPGAGSYNTYTPNQCAQIGKYAEEYMLYRYFTLPECGD